MSVDPMEARIRAFLKKPLREQLDMLVRPWAGPDEPWLSQGVALALLMRILVESSHRLEGLTNRLFWLTVVLSILTGVLAYDVSAAHRELTIP